jgi:hypothetical protein
MPSVATVTKQKPAKKRAKTAQATKKAAAGKSHKASGASAPVSVEPSLAGKYGDVLVNLERARRAAKAVNAPIDDAIEELMRRVEDAAGYDERNLERARRLLPSDPSHPTSWRTPYPTLMDQASGRACAVRSERQRLRDLKESAIRAEKLHQRAVAEGMDLLDGAAIVAELGRIDREAS